MRDHAITTLVITSRNLPAVVRALRAAVPSWSAPVVSEMSTLGHDPYQILIATLLSLRTKDTTTGPAARRLFAVADTPAKMLALDEKRIAELIYPVGFYRTKARLLREISRVLIEKYGGRVPDDLEELLTLKGVGRKTANLVITEGFGKPGICVDTHVHRISNRWGYVKTRSPEETEMALRERLPPRYWNEINFLLVALGQTLCHPLSPRCSACPVAAQCGRVGVTRSR